jgi:hypothetical protein
MRSALRTLRLFQEEDPCRHDRHTSQHSAREFLRCIVKWRVLHSELQLAQISQA